MTLAVMISATIQNSYEQAAKQCSLGWKLVVDKLVTDN